MKNVPVLLIIFRLLLAPIILFLAYFQGKEQSFVIVCLLFLGLLSDVFDGIIARNQGVSSANLRRMDSQVDMIFWLSTGFATYFMYPELITAQKWAVLFLLSMELSCYVVSILRFGKETCTHAYLSKLWGITLLLAFSDLILHGNAGVFFQICIVTGIVSHLDRILITLNLPNWQHDIPSAWHAFQIKRGRSITKFRLFNG